MSLYLVTGGAGFIGSHIASALSARGDRVRVLDDLSGGDRENLAHLEVGGPGSGALVELWVGDVADPATAREACRGARGIFHEAALVSVPRSVVDPGASFRINVQGTRNLLDAARSEGVSAFVFASSSAVYGDGEVSPKREDLRPRPLSPYACDKLACEGMLEAWAHTYGLRAASLRYFNVYGPRQSDSSPYSGVIALFARAVLEGRPVTIYGDGEQTRDFVFVEDVVRANLAAMEAELEPGCVLNVGSGTAVSIKELHRQLGELGKGAAAAAHAEGRAGDVRHSLADVTRIREALGFEAVVGLKEGLTKVLDWYREEGGLQSAG